MLSFKGTLRQLSIKHYSIKLEVSRFRFNIKHHLFYTCEQLVNGLSCFHDFKGCKEERRENFATTTTSGSLSKTATIETTIRRLRNERKNSLSC